MDVGLGDAVRIGTVAPNNYNAMKKQQTTTDIDQNRPNPPRLDGFGGNAKDQSASVALVSASQCVILATKVGGANYLFRLDGGHIQYACS